MKPSLRERLSSAVGLAAVGAAVSSLLALAAQVALMPTGLFGPPAVTNAAIAGARSGLWGGLIAGGLRLPRWQAMLCFALVVLFRGGRSAVRHAIHRAEHGDTGLALGTVLCLIGVYGACLVGGVVAVLVGHRLGLGPPAPEQSAPASRMTVKLAHRH